MQTRLPSERRRHQRIPVSLLVQHRASLSEPLVTDYATDLSASGLFIRTTTQIAEGDTLQVTFAPQKNAAIVEAYCRVTRVTEDGVGAEFIQLDSEAAELLAMTLAA